MTLQTTGVSLICRAAEVEAMTAAPHCFLGSRGSRESNLTLLKLSEDSRLLPPIGRGTASAAPLPRIAPYPSRPASRFRAEADMDRQARLVSEMNQIGLRAPLVRL